MSDNNSNRVYINRPGLFPLSSFAHYTDPLSLVPVSHQRHPPSLLSILALSPPICTGDGCCGTNEGGLPSSNALDPDLMSLPRHWVNRPVYCMILRNRSRDSWLSHNMEDGENLMKFPL